ncbi:MAG: TRAP transporter substrate-binding protein [Halanaeroarchaeum sp.]
MTDQTFTRRDLLAGTGTAAAIGLAGCTGTTGGSGGTDGGSGGSTSSSGGTTTFRYGTVGSSDGNSMGDLDPYGAWTLADRLDRRSDGDVQMNIIGSGQLCGEQDCVSKIMANIVEAGTTSVGNSTKYSPENDLWALPYLFPADNRAALSYGIFSEEAWKRFWVPFGKKYNYVPFFGYPAQHRVLHIGQSGAAQLNGERVRVPDQIEGMDIRRTVSRIPAKAIRQWGASPVKVSWGDSIQGLKSGLIAGMETWLTNVAAYGMLPSLDQTVKNNWSLGIEMSWVNVDWLQGIDTEHRALLAEETRKVTRDLVRNTPEIITERNGAVHTPPEDSAYGKHDIKVNDLTESQLERWRDPVAYTRNRELYTRTYESAADILGSAEEAQAFADSIYDMTRSGAAPKSTTEFSVPSWWDDHLEKI